MRSERKYVEALKYLKIRIGIFISVTMLSNQIQLKWSFISVGFFSLLRCFNLLQYVHWKLGDTMPTDALSTIRICSVAQKLSPVQEEVCVHHRFAASLKESHLDFLTN